MTDQKKPGWLGQIRTLASAMVERANISKRLGLSYGGDRDIYTALGYPTTLEFAHYMARYSRQDVAARIIDAPVLASWKRRPEITENAENETTFEKEWKDIVDDSELKLWHYIIRADKLAGVGEYSVLFLGFDDGEEDLSQEPTNAKSLIYLRAYSQENATIKSYDNDPRSPRFGKPELYQLKAKNLTTGSQDIASGSLVVHWKRIVHLAEGLLEDELLGTPRLKKVYNRLQDLELVAGGSAEMFWRGAFPGMGFMADADADLDTETKAAMGDQIEEYVHGLKRYLRLQGVTIQELAQQVASPEGHVSVLLELIAGATGIPKRILVGSERGELSSAQDDANWMSRVDERRTDYCEPIVMRSVIDRLILVGVLSEPKDGYTVDWPDLFSPSEKEQADTAKVRTETLAAYVNANGADLIVPPEVFLEKFLGFTQDEVKQAMDLIDTTLASERDDADADDATIADDNFPAEDDEEIAA